MKWFSVLVLGMGLLMAASASAAENEADAVLGEWYTDEDKSIVEIYRLDDKFYGKIVWLKEPYTPEGSEKRDIHNPDESKRDDSIIGLQLLSDFRYSGRNRLDKGTVYDPNDGKTYSCKMRLKGDRLKIRGYVGIAVFGRTTIWRRKQ